MSERVVGIHQPNYLPWIGYFHKIYASDLFVLLDDVEYTSGSWINRNRIKTPDGWTWLTVPVTDSQMPIHDVRIASGENWREEHKKSLQHNYGGAEYFDQWEPFLRDTYDRKWSHLSRLNRHLLETICERVGIEHEFVLSSNFDVDATASERLATICGKLDADVYLCGMGADEYMNESVFETQRVAVEYQSFDHPTYEQRFGEFVPKLTFLDACLNLGGDGARSLLKSL